MSTLFDLAKAAVATKARTKERTAAMKALRNHIKSMEEDRANFAHYIELARERHQNEEVEIDDDATFSEADYHVWVSAWVYVPRPEMDEDEEDDEDAQD